MSTTTATSPAVAAPKSVASPYKVSFGHLLKAEWIKLWSVRSTVWTLSIMIVVMVGLVAAVAGLSVANGAEGEAETGAALGYFALIPAVNMASLAVVVLGVLSITGEYTTGMIRASAAAAPRRTPVLWSKMTVLFAVILGASVIAVALAYLVELLILGPKDLALDLSDPEALRVLGGCALYLATISIFAFALGALLRHSAAALATVLGLLLVIETVVGAIPWKPLQYVSPLLPATAGGKITQPDSLNEMMNSMTDAGANLNAWQGYGVLVAWVVVILAVAALLMRRRDV